MAETKTEAEPKKRGWRVPRGGGKKACSVPNCKKPYRAKGYCFFHYKKWRRGEVAPETKRYKLCSHEECKKARFKGAYCEQHFNEKKAGAKADQPAPVAPAAPAAQG